MGGRDGSDQGGLARRPGRCPGRGLLIARPGGSAPPVALDPSPSASDRDPGDRKRSWVSPGGGLREAPSAMHRRTGSDSNSSILPSIAAGEPGRVHAGGARSSRCPGKAVGSGGGGIRGARNRRSVVCCLSTHVEATPGAAPPAGDLLRDSEGLLDRFALPPLAGDARRSLIAPRLLSPGPTSPEAMDG
jgi:hypothetical protein